MIPREILAALRTIEIHTARLANEQLSGTYKSSFKGQGLAFREVYRVEGIVNQLAGDGFMALFGAPVAHEDAPHRGVSAALAIRDAVVRLSEEVRRRRGLELFVRTGVHTGPVVVGAVGLNSLKEKVNAARCGKPTC